MSTAAYPAPVKITRCFALTYLSLQQTLAQTCQHQSPHVSTANLCFLILSRTLCCAFVLTGASGPRVFKPPFPHGNPHAMSNNTLSLICLTGASEPRVLKPPLPRGNPHMMSSNTLFPWQQSSAAPWADTLDVSLLPDEYKTGRPYHT
jgi:hypothetical protein